MTHWLVYSYPDNLSERGSSWRERHILWCGGSTGHRYFPAVSAVCAAHPCRLAGSRCRICRNVSPVLSGKAEARIRTSLLERPCSLDPSAHAGLSGQSPARADFPGGNHLRPCCRSPCAYHTTARGNETAWNAQVLSRLANCAHGVCNVCDFVLCAWLVSRERAARYV